MRPTDYDTAPRVSRPTSGLIEQQRLFIAFAGLPFEELAAGRSALFTFPPDIPLRVCSAEDLIVLKAFADRPKDWRTSKVSSFGSRRDWIWLYVQSQLAPLAELKEAPELLARLERTRERCES